MRTEAGPRRTLARLLLASLLPACLMLGACQRTAPPATHAKVVTLGNQGAHVEPLPARPAPPPADYLSGTHWPDAQLADGNAWISCNDDYNAAGDGIPVASLDF